MCWSNIEVTPNNSIKSSPILPSRGWVIGDNDHQYLHDISHNLSHNHHDDARSAILWPVLVQGWREYQQLNPIGLQSAAVRIIFSCYFGHQYIHAIFYHLSHYRVDYARGVTLLPESAQSLGEYQKLIQIVLHYAALLNLFSVFNSAIKYRLYCTTYYIIIGLMRYLLKCDVRRSKAEVNTNNSIQSTFTLPAVWFVFLGRLRWLPITQPNGFHVWLCF